MAGIEIANAYVALTTKMPGLQGNISKALGGPAVKSSVDKAGSSLGSKLMGTMTKTVKGAAATVGGTIAAGIGTALVKGFARLNAIDTAQAKLKGLGNDSKTVSKVMDNALASVKGTAFGLGDAATVGAQAVASGIKPGKELEGVLKSVANSAAASGSEMSEMGSIYAKVASTGKAQNDVLSQVADRGIPIYQALADQLGVTADEVFAMASKGKIGFAEFQDAMTSAAGTVATELSNTVGGSWSNFIASLGRVGAGLLGGVFPQIAPSIQGITSALAPLEDAAGKVGEKVGKVLAPAFDWLGKALSGKVDFSAFSSVLSYLTPLGAVMQILQPILPAISDGLGEIGKALGGALADALPVIIPALVTLVTQLAELAAQVIPVLLPVVISLVSLFSDAASAVLPPLVDVLLVAVGVLKDWAIPLGVIVGAMFAYQKAMALATVAQNVYSLGTKGAALAQKGLNLAMKANPIGLIITAVMALVGALVWFFTKTETGKKAWAAFTGFLKTAWETVGKPVFDGIAKVVTWLWDTVIHPIFTLIVNYYRFWGAVAVWLWKHAVQPVLKKIGDGFVWLWNNAVKPVIDWIKKKLDILGLGFRILYSQFIKPAWDSVKSTLHAGWTWVKEKVFAPMGKGIDLIRDGFKAGADAIGLSWGKIKEAAAKPINFVLDTVWNNGIRKFWNTVVGELGLDDMKLPEAKTVKFASGGVMPGYTPGRDVHEFYSPTAGYLHLSGGEAIMRPEFTRMVGGKAGVDALNAKARRGEAFADGGVFGWAKDAWSGVTNFAGDVWDNIKNAAKLAAEFVTDPVGAVKTHIIDGIINPLVGSDGNIFLKTAAQLPINAAKGLGQKVKDFIAGGGTVKGQGAAGMGWQAMWDMVKAAIPGAVLTSSTRPAGTKTVNGGLSYHSQGRAIDVVPATMDTFAKMKALFPNARELIFSPAGNQQLLNGKPHFWGGAVRAQHWNHVHAAMANGGVVPKLYDQGGWLPHGGVGLNLTGQPEAVLTPSESVALKKGLGGGALINGDVTFQSSGDFASDLDKLSWELRKLGRGGR